MTPPQRNDIGNACFADNWTFSTNYTAQLSNLVGGVVLRAAKLKYQ